MSWDSAPYITLWDALRLTLALNFPDGRQLAKEIPSATHVFVRCRNDEVALEKLRSSCRTLEAWLGDNRIHGVGNTFGVQEQRTITEVEWGTFEIALGENCLKPLDGLRLPWVVNIRVRSKDICHLAEARVASVGRSTASKTKTRPGRPPSASWPEIKMLLKIEIKKRGEFPEHGGQPGWRRQADAIRFVSKVLEDRKETVEASAIRDNTRRLLEELKAEMGENG